MQRLILLTLLAIGLPVCPALAQLRPPDDDLTGHYRGFAQSALNPALRMPMALSIDGSEGAEFFGSLTLGPMPFAFQGKIDEAGHFKGRGTGAAGDVTFNGTAQSFGGGGVLARATYKFTPATGARADQGIADFIRALVTPPDPITPVAGTYIGTYVSHLGRSKGTLRMELMQEGTSLTGQLFLDEGTARALSWEVVGGIVPCVIEGGIQPCTTVGGIQPCVIVGGIAPCVEVVLIGAGTSGRLVAGGAVEPPPDDGPPPPDDSLTAVVSLEFLGGGVDLATITARRQRAAR